MRQIIEQACKMQVKRGQRAWEGEQAAKHNVYQILFTMVITMYFFVSGCFCCYDALEEWRAHCSGQEGRKNSVISYFTSVLISCRHSLNTLLHWFVQKLACTSECHQQPQNRDKVSQIPCCIFVLSGSHQHWLIIAIDGQETKIPASSESWLLSVMSQMIWNEVSKQFANALHLG